MKFFKLLTCIALFITASSIANAAENHVYTACVFDKTTGKVVRGASIRIWSPDGSVCAASTESNGCTSSCGFGYSAGHGGFIEAVATIRGRRYRQQFMLPTNPDALFTGFDYRYDFYLDTLKRPR